jgi:3',5'-nucleoside bisphosphate phosphatase
MKNSRIVVCFVLCVLTCATTLAQWSGPRREIAFPAPESYETMACDLHMHTVFSDGSVWPNVRVNEAWRLGLDAIAITDHIEYQPHKNDLPTSHNRPFEIANGAAQTHNIIFPRASEITRSTPPGHFNALFLEDQSLLDVEDFVAAIEAANDQDAFVFWNHQAWKGEENGAWQDVHTTIFDNGWLHGMEVANGGGYHPTAHRWCLEKGLTMLGNSDIHAPELEKETTPEVHRTMTLVFVQERSMEGLKEALFEGRTVVWFGDKLIGREPYLSALYDASILVHPTHAAYRNRTSLLVENLCDQEITLTKRGEIGPQEIVLPARRTTLVQIDVPDPSESYDLEYTASNLWIAPEEGLPVTLRVARPEE